MHQRLFQARVPVFQGQAKFVCLICLRLCTLATPEVKDDQFIRATLVFVKDIPYYHHIGRCVRRAFFVRL